MALSVKNMLGGGGAFYPSVFATGVSQSDDVRLFKIVDGEPVKEITSKKWVDRTVLPSAYQEVDYIESTGTQYINTGYSNTNGWSMIANVMRSSNASALVKLCGINGSGSECLVFWTESTKLVNIYNGGVSKQTNSPIGLNDAMHKVECKLTTTQTYFAIDDTVVINESGTYTSRLSGNVPIMCGIRNGSTIEDGFSGRWGVIHFFNNDGTEVHTFVPCYRKSDNVVGMYDTVSNTFYTNSGTGTFLKGADVLKDGYVFKLNELGMYRLVANNGTITRATDVLVDYPLEYVVPVSYRVYLLDRNNQYADVTGGYTGDGYRYSNTYTWQSYSTDTQGIYTSSSSSAYYVKGIGSANTIDFTGYNKLCIETDFTAFKNDGSTEYCDYNFLTTQKNPALSGAVKLLRSKGKTGVNVNEFDVSDINGSYYLFFSTFASAYYYCTGHITRVWLE